MDMVDWNPKSPDGWTGLQFAPTLEQDGAVSVRNIHVLQANAADLSSSDLTVKADLRNNTDEARTTVLDGMISRSGTHRSVRTRVTVPAHDTQTVTLPTVHLRRPAIWWPYQMGSQPMYNLAVQASVSGRPSDRASEDFGIRTITSYLTPVVPGKTLAPNGYRQFVINGRPFVVRGGGWSQELFLRYSRRNVHDQLSYIRNLGLNAIRFEGNLPPDDLFTQLDRMGILAMPGWQCCDKWEQLSSRWTDEIKASAANQALHVMYAYDDGSIKVVKLTGSRRSRLTARAEFIDLDGTARASVSAPVSGLGSQDVATVLHPAVPAGISTTYFLKLTLTDHGKVVDRNVYWLSTKPDQVDFDRTIGGGSGAEFVPGGYADLTGLQQLAPATVRASAHSHRDGGDVVTTVTIRNVSSQPAVGFLLRADVRRSTGGDNQVLPIRWSHNDVTL